MDATAHRSSIRNLDRVAILAHGAFPDRAKTAVGILRYGSYDVTAVIDKDRPGTTVNEYVPDVIDCPIVPSMADAPDCDALVIGVSPIGGEFDDSWRPDVRTALERGCDVIAGLHYFLAEDEEFASLADEYGCDLWDVRQPPEDLRVSEGVADTVDAAVVLTVGTDCSSGKQTTTMELAKAARDRGIDAAVIPTGQTGILIEGWGIAVDRVVSDFAAGAVEQMILEEGNRELLFVEGQGSIVHPAYSGVTTSILHGAMPDALVLCHVAGRNVIHGYDDTNIPSPETYVSIYESLAAPVRETTVAAGALATHHIENDRNARAAIARFEDRLDAPTTDPVRFDPAVLLDATLHAVDSREKHK